MKLEVGKSYKTRNGKKVNIIGRKYWGPSVWPYLSDLSHENESKDFITYREDGTHSYEYNIQSETDIVSEWNECNFKIGDKVKDIGDSRISVITDICFDTVHHCWYVYLNGSTHKDRNGECPSCFELVETKAAVSHENSISFRNYNPNPFLNLMKKRDIDQLIETTRAGEKASQRLKYEYGEDVEYRGSGSDWFKIKIIGKFEFRIVNKESTFESFTTSNGWLITIKPMGDLFIGCRNFTIEETKKTLIVFLRSLSCSHSSCGITFYATWKGISDGTNTLLWADAEKLLNSLEKAGY